MKIHDRNIEYVHSVNYEKKNMYKLQVWRALVDTNESIIFREPIN
jgi:hypothetical protein